MSYLLTCATVFTDGAPAERRAETALDALGAFVAYLREDHVAPILDDAGELVSPARLLEEARSQAADPQSRQRLIDMLADYATAAGRREYRSARERYGVLNSDEYEAHLLDLEAEHSPLLWRREADAEERSRLRELFDDHSIWHLAGVAWYRDFHVLPPEEVVTELRARGARPHVHELRLGAEGELRRHGGRPPRYQVLPSPDGPSCRVWDSETGRVERKWALHSIAQAHVDALNAGRPWDDRNYGRELDLWARARVDRRPRQPPSSPGSAAPPAASPIPPRRSSGRQL